MKKVAIAAVLAVAPTVTFAQADDPFGYEFDDYLCHDIPRSQWIKPHYRLHMADQFGETTSEALRAVFICNPVKKQVLVKGDVVAEDGINNEELHFICYEFDPGATDAENKGFKVENQFESDGYRSGGPKMICVPTLKYH